MTQRNDSSEQSERPAREGERFAGLHGLVEAFRRLPNALRRPETLMLVMAIFASFGAHMPPYLGLGALADYFEDEQEKRAESEPVEVSFEWNEPPTEAAEPDEVEPEQQAKLEPTPKTKPSPSKPEPEAPKPEAPKPEVPKPEPEPESEPERLAQPAPPPPPRDKRMQSITQKSPDPEVEAPDDARFLAEQNRSVAEETVAEVRDLVHDDAEPEASAPQDLQVDKAGDAKENTEEVETFNESGRDTEGEKLADAERAQESRSARSEAPPEPTRGSEAREARDEVAASKPSPGTVIQDPLGSFTLAAAEAPSERRKAQTAQRASQAGQRGTRAPNLAVSWQAFEDTFDADTLAAEREPQRRSRVGSSERKKTWKEYRAAIENYVTGVKPGNHTALSARADPFAAYLAAFHRHLHESFAFDFLNSLPATGELADRGLFTKVEMVVNPDGTLDRVGLLRTSGQSVFDFGAFNAVHKGAPYPRTPENIRSADGKVYMRWELHRDEQQCGTWNAELFIVSSPPDVGTRGVPGLQLGPTRGGPG